MLKIFLCLFLIFLPFSDSVANKKENLISELIDLLRMQDLHEYEVETYQKSIDEIIKQSDKGAQNNLTEIKIFKKKVREIISDEFNWVNFKQDCIRIYSEEYNIHEVEELISYYKSPIGKKATKKQLEIQKKIIAISSERRKIFLDKVRRLSKDIAFKTPAIKSSPENMAVLYLNVGNEFYGKEEYLLAINSYYKAIDLNPNDFQGYNNLGWLLSTCPDKQLRNGQKAVELAKKAYSINQEIYVVDTLAAAYAEVGEYAKAISLLQNAITDLMHSGAKDTEIKLYSDHLNEIKNKIR